MDNTYEKLNVKPHLVYLEYDETFTTENGNYEYLIGKKENSNVVLLQRKNINGGTENVNLDYAWYEIEKNIEEVKGSLDDSISRKKAYMKYLLRHYNLGCKQYKDYKGYQKLVDFIKPLIIDYEKSFI